MDGLRRRLSSMPAGALAVLVAIAVVLLLAFLRPGWGVVIAVVIVALAPGRWWRWRTRRFRRGVRALERGEPDRARSELRRFLRDIEDDRLFARAQPLFNLGREYSYRAAALANLGLAALREGAVPKALRRFGEALEEDPFHAQAHYGRGIAHRSRGELAEAERAATRAVEARPRYLAAHALLGLVRRERGDEGGAEAALAAIRKEDRDPEELLERLRKLWPA